jgi:N-acetylmuramoyl-L-alanine amidase
MSNADEDAKLNTSEYQDKMFEGMAEGIIRYFAEKS